MIKNNETKKKTQQFSDIVFFLCVFSDFYTRCNSKRKLPNLQNKKYEENEWMKIGKYTHTDTVLNWEYGHLWFVFILSVDLFIFPSHSHSRTLFLSLTLSIIIKLNGKKFDLRCLPEKCLCSNLILRRMKMMINFNVKLLSVQ